MDIGPVIAKRYRIKREIGSGGMGVVWLAHDEHLGRDVALKTMNTPPGLTQDQRARDAERFRREARAAARLDHTGIATVYDLGEERGTRFLVMQYVTGVDLEDRIAEQERLSIEEAASVGVQIASVLGSVHARNVVHRDLKGRNVIIRTDGVVKVLDFGVAAFLEPDTAKLTTTGERPGSLECMAPEQILGKLVDHRTDLYALGCLLHKMLTGEPVFEHRSELMLPGLILDHPPIPLRDLRPDAPSDLESLVTELLAKAPNDRPAHAGEVWRRLASWLPERGDPAAALTPWAEVDPLRPFRHPMGPDARPVRSWARPQRQGRLG
ncbi:serine/threonine-protein kinase [Streptomyces sp. A1499]|uniref:serine/threonine-protein kinase n=1 Tax=Streptomyces sp. A1499 TaxID=2563104 RepID=UPI00109ECA73|nr:serine/threonine-protein kinase [Streptomyces sp. A1499]THC47312.1 serine/threonine protein kinase [Streptomyces sp. A1499]